MPAPSLLVRLLRAPRELVPTLTDADWDLLIRQARWSMLLARVAFVLKDDGLWEHVPERAGPHFEGAELFANRQAAAARIAIDELQRELWSHGVPIILLKGAAYLAASLPASPGRVFSDIDIMVPRGAIEEVERALLNGSWVAQPHDAYDDRYYRQWMHEIPPLMHRTQGTVLDIHHTILPPTARLKPDPALLLEAAVELDWLDEVYTLCPEDLVLHSATHLFHDGELEHGLRDLVDLDALLVHFGADPAFWERLLARARVMDLEWPLYCGLRYVALTLETEIPRALVEALDAAGPPDLMRPLTDAVFMRALAPAHASCADWLTPTARWLMYVRSHYLRMPVHLLVPHLVRKAWVRRFDQPS